MGMYTSIIHPDDGRELQIKSGWDDCETYHVGDIVEWFIDKDAPKEGKLLDDVYSSYSDKGDDDWVVIKDHQVLTLIPRTKNEYGDHQILRDRFGIKDLPDSEWSDEAWAEKIEQEKQWEKEDEEFQKSIEHFSDNEKFIAQLLKPICRSLNYESISTQLLTIEQLDKSPKDK
jgi:hypothetical protein